MHVLPDRDMSDFNHSVSLRVGVGVRHGRSHKADNASVDIADIDDTWVFTVLGQRDSIALGSCIHPGQGRWARLKPKHRIKFKSRTHYK